MNNRHAHGHFLGVAVISYMNLGHSIYTALHVSDMLYFQHVRKISLAQHDMSSDHLDKHPWLHPIGITPISMYTWGLVLTHRD